MNKALANWRTTLAGIGALCLAVGAFLTGDGTISLEQVATLLAGLGLVASKDGATGSAP